MTNQTFSEPTHIRQGETRPMLQSIGVKSLLLGGLFLVATSIIAATAF